MGTSGLEDTNDILAKGLNSSIIGAKRSREDEVYETERNREMKSEEHRQPMATTDAAQEVTDAPATNKAPQYQQAPSFIVVATGTPDSTILSPDKTTVNASTGQDTTAAAPREANAAELVTVHPLEAQAPLAQPPPTRSSSAEDQATSGTTKSSNNSVMETSSVGPSDTPTFTGSNIQRVGDGDTRSPAASRHEASLVLENDKDSHEQQAPTSAGQWGPERVKKCQVCGKEDRRYCCPRCGKLTCSLSCCVRHKKEAGCNGKRDKVGFVSLKDFTDAHLRSDFNFLEDALRCVDGGKRELSKRPGVVKSRKGVHFTGHRGRGQGRGRGRSHHGNGKGASSPSGLDSGDDHRGKGAFSLLLDQHQGWLSGRAPRLKRLVKEAALRGTRLLLMPDGMARRDGNTTTTISDAPSNGDQFSIRERGGGRGGVLYGNGATSIGKKRQARGDDCQQQKQQQKSESPSNRGNVDEKGLRSAELQENGGRGSLGPMVECNGVDKDEEGYIGGAPLSKSSATRDVSGVLLAMETSIRGISSSLSWKVEWVFCEMSAAREGNTPEGIHVTDTGVSEGCLLHEALSKHLQPRPNNAPLRHRLRSFVKPWASMNPAGRVEALPGDRNALPSEGLRLFLKRVPCPVKTPVYWELNCRESLGKALKGKTVIEFPTIYVALVGPESTAFRTLVSEILPVDSGDAALVDEVEKALTVPEPINHEDDGGVLEAHAGDVSVALLEEEEIEEKKKEDEEEEDISEEEGELQ